MLDGGGGGPELAAKLARALLAHEVGPPFDLVALLELLAHHEVAGKEVFAGGLAPRGVAGLLWFGLDAHLFRLPGDRESDGLGRELRARRLGRWRRSVGLD